MSAETVLTIDLGTQSVRALAFDARGKLLDSAQLAFDPPYHSPQPGWAEQDPTYYWDCVGRACQQLWQQGRVAPDALAGVSMTFQRATMVFVGADGQPTRPAILWLDQRRASEYQPLPGALRLVTSLMGVQASIDRLIAGAPLNWVRQHQPEVWAATSHYLMLSGFITFKFTGELRDSVACQVGQQPFDYKRQTWHKASDWSWKSFPVTPQMLPELMPPGEAMGQVSEQAAAHTGLPAGLPVISAGSDKACEVLGSGCVDLDQGCIGFGTTATFNIDSPRYTEPVMLVPAYASAQPGHWNLEFQIYRGFWMVSWFKQQFAQLEAQRAKEQGKVAEQLLEELANEVPPGSLGLTLQPYWSPGVIYPGVEAKGAIVGFGSAHHKPHMYRAMLEGLAYGMREGCDRTVKRTRTPLRELHICGGGSQSDLAMQIAADVFGMPTTRPALYEASGLGAAMLAAVGLGLHPDLATAVQQMQQPGPTFEPRAEAVQVYDQLYHEVYRKLYGRLRKLYQRIMQITGYPAPPGTTDAG